MDDYRWLDADDGMRWVEQRRELNGLIADVLRDDEIEAEIRALGIPAIEVARAVRDRPDVIARYRRRRSWSRLTPADEREAGRGGIVRLAGKRLAARLPPGGGLVLGLVIAFGYLGVLLFWSFDLLEAGWRALRRGIRRSRYPQLAFLRTEAFDQLRRIRFLHTYTSGWSGKIGLPAGVEAGWTASVQRAEQNRTNPEIVESFRDFARWSAFALTRTGMVERIVIAVDELDKIDDPAQAQELVNDIKGVFGIPNCLFLVSVSEDAMSAFERRGIPVRDAFDSAFTRMVRMDHFTLAESRRWLSRRLLGVPEQFIYLLHCLSGGLPRELHRVTTELVDIVAEDERGDLEHVTGVLLDRELDRKGHAFTAAARRCDDTAGRSDFLADLVTIPDARTPAAQAALAQRLVPRESGADLRQVRWQSAFFLLFCATVRAIFDNGLGPSGLGQQLESLAVARAQLAVDPQVAWRLVESVRAGFSLG